MAGVGRKRKDGNPLGLEPRVEWHHGQFRYLHRDGSKEQLGKDVEKANGRARIYNDPKGEYGTLGYFIMLFIADARAGRLPAGRKLGERTLGDYETEAEFLMESPLWRMLPADLAREPNLIGEYRDRRAPNGVGEVQANHALSLLSSTYDWIIEKTLCPGLLVNPVALITRFKRDAKDRYVEDHEYRPVYARAIPAVRMGLELAYATLQRPEDILSLPPNPVRQKSVAGTVKRVISITQGKRGRTVDIEATAELERTMALLAPPPPPPDGTKVVKLATALVHGRDGTRYTTDGFAAMLRRYCLKAKVKPFGLMDVRAKGATDMYLRGVPLEVIQRLMAHKSVTTTEIYIKRLLATISTVTPNAVKVGG